MTEISNDELEKFRAEIRKQAREQAAKWTLATITALVVFAIGGWWFALKPLIITELGGVPSGAVLAFSDARYSDQITKGNTSTEGCPEGWIRFKEAEGRFVIGADARSQNDNSGQYWLLRQDGSSNIFIEPRNLPNHVHVTDLGNNARLVDPSKFDHGASNSPLVDDAGQRHPYAPVGNRRSLPNADHRADAINVLPPFIALYLCKKT